MKRSFSILPILALLAMLVMPALGQVTTNSLFSTNDTVLTAGKSIINTVFDAVPTNFGFAASAVYAPSGQPGAKLGGALTATYNVTDNLGAVVGMEYLGQWWGINGQMQLGVTVHPLSFLSTNGFAANLTVHPFVDGGIATSLKGSGSDGSLQGIAGGGVALDIAKVFGGTFGIHGGDNYWTGPGKYGNQSHFFGGIFWEKAIW